MYSQIFSCDPAIELFASKTIEKTGTIDDTNCVGISIGHNMPAHSWLVSMHGG